MNLRRVLVPYFLCSFVQPLTILNRTRCVWGFIGVFSGRPPIPVSQCCPFLFSCWSSWWCWSSRPTPNARPCNKVWSLEGSSVGCFFLLINISKLLYSVSTPMQGGGVWRAAALGVFYVSMFLCFCILYLRLCNKVWRLEGSTSSSRSVGMRRSGSLGSPRLQTIHSNSSSQSSSLSSLSPSPSRSLWSHAFWLSNPNTYYPTSFILVSSLKFTV